MDRKEENKNKRRDKKRFKAQYGCKVLGLPLGKSKYERVKKQPPKSGCFLLSVAV